MTIRICALFGLAVVCGCARAPGRVDAVPESMGGVDLERTWDPVEVAAWSDEAGVEPPVRDVVYTEPGELPQLLAAGVALPLRNTDVRAQLRGAIAEVVVKQRFVNDNGAALDAVYTFPLPENSAVTDMRMIVGARVIEAEIRERTEAQQVFRAAQAAGHTAALLEQERPNVFTQSLANIPAGETIEVEIRYLQTLSYDAGEYEFVFPTVVGPRYLPGEPLARANLGAGGAADTDRVPDASRISPPILGHGMRTGHDLSIEVVAEAGAPITAWAVPAHEVRALASGPRLQVELARRDEIPNRDFVLRYRSAGARPHAKLFLGPASKEGGHFMLVVDPPRVDVDEVVGRRELIFVVDVSGSMHGAPLALAKAAMHEALARARPVDTFDVVTFAGRTGRLFGTPRPANADNLRQANDFVDGLGAGGGTEMRAAVDVALREPVADGRHRYVFLLTDGYIGEEDAIAGAASELVARQRREGRQARVFGIGIGEAPNSHLIEVLSRAGRGTPLHVRRPLDLARAGQTVERIIDAPVVTDIEFEWGSLAVRDLSVAKQPDLLASHPLVVHGRYTGAAPAELRLRGRVGARSVTFPVEVVAAGESDAVLSRLWARDRIADLDLTLATAESDLAGSRAQAEILALGLRHHLVTQFTSLVAVDRSRRVDGPVIEVVQPVEVPAGVDPVMAGSVRSDSAQVTKVNMSQARNIPVGGTSRDFTAVVDMSPTVSRDSAGIRLGGSTGAESRYMVDGRNITSPAYGTVGASIVQEYIDVHEVSRGFQAVEPYARARIRGVTAARTAEAATLRARLRGDAEALARCFLDDERATYRVHRQLVLVVHLDAGGAITKVDVRGRKPPSAAALACLRKRVDPLVRAAIRGGGSVEIDLGVWMRF